VHVIDNGAGIPAEILPKIYDPFFTTKPVGKGTGLGLDVVNRLLQNHQAAISVQSEPGTRGSRCPFRSVSNAPYREYYCQGMDQGLVFAYKRGPLVYQRYLYLKIRIGENHPVPS
jgi:signal transduction histidine kinase